MGFLSKIGKGIKGAFKKVGKAIKSGLKSVGKFMDKIGIVGQIGLSLLLPGIGAMLGKAFTALTGATSFTGALTAYSGVGSTIINGAGKFLANAGKFASQVGKSFSSITEGVKSVVGETLKAGANALGVDTAFIETGKSLGSEYLQNLGESISKANFDSIGAQFGESAEAVVSSFSKIGTGFGTAPAKGITVGEGGELPMTEPMTDAQVAEINANAVDALPQDSLLSSPQQGVTVGADTPDLYGPGFDPAQRGVTVGADTPDLYGINSPQRLAEEDAFSAAREQALGELSSVGKQEGFINRTARGVKEAIIKEAKPLMEDPGGTIVGYGKKVGAEAFESGIKKGTTSVILEKGFNVDTTPDVYQTSYGTYIPDIDYSLVEPASTSNLLNFMNQNQDFINTHPFGATAAVVENFYPQMLRRNQSYGG